METLLDFLKKFNISQSEYESTGLIWDNLLKIKADYEDYIPELSPPANYLIDAFHNVKSIHSVRFRIKNPVHLIEKLIRKRIEEPERVIDINNYRSEITDLIGLRALHLFKEDWISIHHFISNTWDLNEEPIAYYRNGDSPEYIENFQKLGCKVKEHPHGYRSVHYLVKTSPNKKTYVSEVQVRTIFEEGWSEIDHKIRYPYNRDNKILSQFLVMFNRLSGNADEMGSYIQYLKNELEKKEKEYKDAVDKQICIVEDLKKRIKELELKPKEVLQWQSKLDEILKIPSIDLSNLEYKIPDFSTIQFPTIEFPDISPIKFPTIEYPDYLKIYTSKPKLPEIKTDIPNTVIPSSTKNGVNEIQPNLEKNGNKNETKEIKEKKKPRQRKK